METKGEEDRSEGKDAGEGRTWHDEVGIDLRGVNFREDIIADSATDSKDDRENAEGNFTPKQNRDGGREKEKEVPGSNGKRRRPQEDGAVQRKRDGGREVEKGKKRRTSGKRRKNTACIGSQPSGFLPVNFPLNLVAPAPNTYPFPIQLVPVVFQGTDRIGDFRYEAGLVVNRHALFIFNDNVCDMNTNIAGSGNALFRPWAFLRPYPRAVGIPTGDVAGFTSLGEMVRGYSAIHHIRIGLQKLENLLQSGQYDRIIYSGNPDGSFRFAIFQPAQEIRDALLAGLQRVATGATTKRKRDEEGDMGKGKTSETSGKRRKVVSNETGNPGIGEEEDEEPMDCSDESEGLGEPEYCSDESDRLNESNRAYFDFTGIDLPETPFALDKDYFLDDPLSDNDLLTAMILCFEFLKVTTTSSIRRPSGEPSNDIVF